MYAIEVHSQEHDGHLSSVLDSHSYSLEVTYAILLSPPLEMEARTEEKEPCVRRLLDTLRCSMNWHGGGGCFRMIEE